MSSSHRGLRNSRCRRMLLMVNEDSDTRTSPTHNDDPVHSSVNSSSLDLSKANNTKLFTNEPYSNSLPNTPQSTLKNINYIASPTILFPVNETELPELSNIETYIHYLEHFQSTSDEPQQQDININTPENLSPSLVEPDNCSMDAYQVDKEVNNNIIGPSNPLNLRNVIDDDNPKYGSYDKSLQTSFIECLPTSEDILDMDSQLIISPPSNSLSTQPLNNASTAPAKTSTGVPVDVMSSDQVTEYEGSPNEANSESVPFTETEIKLTRKRLRNTTEWKDHKNKILKNSGMSYQGVRNNKKRNKKEIGPTCSCKRNCSEKMDETSRQKVFDTYWGLANHEKQWDFILKNISSNSIKRMQLIRKLNRAQTIIYNLPLLNTEIKNIEQITVCKKMFLNTLSIDEKVVYTAIEKNNYNMRDLRGTHLNRPHRMSEETETSIIKHIKEFPVVESHYTRKASKRLYLEETLNQSKMYRLYKEWYAQHGYEHEKLATKSQYETIFKTRFNYSFFRPKKDMCDQCHIFNNADIERKAQLQDEYDKHKEEKEKVRQIKDQEKIHFDKSSQTLACFDLEKVLHIPQSEMSSFYYKRKYPIYNFTIYNILTKSGYCYLWHFQIAKRGAVEIASCLFHYIKQEAANGKHIISFYSDSCTGQNRNRFVFAMYQYASKTFGVTITHRFFVKGHSQSEGDMMHSVIEKAKKRHTIYTPDQMYCIIDNAKVSGEKFKLKEMQQTDIYDFKKLVSDKSKNWLQDDAGNKIMWSKIKEVKTDHNAPDKFFYKYNLEDEYNSLTTTRQVSRRRRICEEFTLQQAYEQLLPVPKPLYNDLISLCNSEAIPIQYQPFYMNLIPQIQSSDVTNNEIDDSSDNEE